LPLRRRLALRINEGGDGNDTIEVNGGGGEQFTVAPSVTPGRIAFDRTGPSPIPGPFNLDTSRRLPGPRVDGCRMSAALASTIQVAGRNPHGRGS
jgi:hypothetical protein